MSRFNDLQGAFKEFLELCSKWSRVVVIPAVNVDSIAAASILTKCLPRSGLDVVMNFSPRSEYREPTLFLDLRSEAKRLSFSIIYGSGINVLHGQRMIAYTNSSIASTILHLAKGFCELSYVEKACALVGGVDRGKDLGKEGFRGIEGDIAAELIEEGVVIEEVGLRLWGWKKRSLAEMLSNTLTPFIPQLSGLSTSAVKFLKDIGVTEPEEATVGDLEREDLFKKLAKELIGKATELSRKKRDAVEFIGKLYGVQVNNEVIYIHEIYGAYVVAISLGGNVLNNLLYLTENSWGLQSLLLLFKRLISRVASEVGRGYSNYVNSLPISTGLVKRPEIYVKVLSDSGLLEERPVILYDSAMNRKYTSLMEAIRTGLTVSEVDSEQLVEVK
ncbi:MAG: hypothetical protein N3E36_05620 [Sulfolobales archaeon]|nr:hypothetical protein [Sulfolobales archaeon]